MADGLPACHLTSLINKIIALCANLDLTDPQGNTALMIAAQAGNLAAVEVLIAARAKLDLRNNDGETALTLAIRRTGNFEDTDNSGSQALKLLIHAEAEPNPTDSSISAAGAFVRMRWGAAFPVRVSLATTRRLKPALHHLPVRQ